MVAGSRGTETEAFTMTKVSEKERGAPVAGEEVWEVRVRERAYAIREREGRPEGTAEWHWLLWPRRSCGSRRPRHPRRASST